MQSPARPPLLALLLLTWSLASCGQDTASQATPIPPATAAPTKSPTQATLQPESTYQPASPTPTPTPSATLSPLPTETSTVQPSATPEPTSLSPPASGDPLAFSLHWRFDSNGHLTEQRIIYVDGEPLFLLASLGRSVFALDKAGHVQWQARMEGPVYTLVAMDRERIASGDDAGFVTLLDGNGRRLWRHGLGTRVTALSSGWQGGVLAGGWDERLTFLSDEGQVRWQAGLDGPVSSITLLLDLAIVATLDGQVKAFDIDGTPVWQLQAGAPVTALAATGLEKASWVTAALQDGRILAFDGAGKLLWQQTLGTGGPVWHAANVTGDPAIEIVAGTGGTRPLLALLSAEGQVFWRTAVPSAVTAITVLDLDGDGQAEILAGLSTGLIQAYDRLGRLRGVLHAGLPVWDLEAAEDGSVLALADVVAWRITGGDGPAGGAWLPPPAMVDALPSPLPAGHERANGEAILTFLGDVAPGRSMEAQLTRYGPAYPWFGLGSLLSEADLAVANLECALTTRGVPLDKSYLIRAHPRWAQTLLAARFNLVTVANNHALDYGPSGLDETLATLEALGIATVGAGSDDRAADRPALLTLNGVRVAILGYAAARWNGSVDVPVTDRLAWAEPKDVQEDVRAIRDQADLVIVLLHAGTEYATTPSQDQIAVAHAAVDAASGASSATAPESPIRVLVVGHHPHVTQTVERYGNGLIVYSLGDALFDIPRPAAMQGHLLRVHVSQEGVTRAELWPFWIEDSIQPKLLANGQGEPRVQLIYP